MDSEENDRVVFARRDLLRMGASASGVVLAGCATAGAGREGARSAESKGAEAEVTPGEDLMQEHGILERILLIYEEAVRRIETHEAFDVAVIRSGAAMIRRFVEDYHEKLEEQFVFPRLQTAQRELALVATLLRQHQRGRELTDAALEHLNRGQMAELATVLRSFGRMYRPHAAREDTVLFPAFREVVGQSAYRELGEQFEDKEHALFGEHGFENNVAEVARLEASLGIADLASFTP